MELILLLCSSGVAGLFTYIYLDYLSLFDTEKTETKKMISILFSLISVGVFIIVKSTMKLLLQNEIVTTLCALIISIIIILILNKWVYINIINKFRENMNESRSKFNQNHLIFSHVIDDILVDDRYFYYIECYRDEYVNNPSMYGLIKKHEIDNNTDVHFLIETTGKIDNEKLDNADSYYVYHKSNSNSFYKIYSFEK